MDKDWLKTVVDKYYNPKKYYVPEKAEAKPTFQQLLDEFLIKHKLSEVRKKNFRVICRAMMRYELFVRTTKRGQKSFALDIDTVTADTLHDMWDFFENEYHYCKHEWVRGICDRVRTKCKDCDKRELLPLSKEVIDNHLRNKDENSTGIVGVYPLLPDETCLFLAIDFDEEKWQNDISTFRSVCKELNIPVAIERSRSGNGAHAWLFFNEPVPAISARKFGNAILTKAMSIRHEIKFSSYNRMFPNQDFMPKGGFGNLIALPLQGGARKNGNSEFVDKN